MQTKIELDDCVVATSEQVSVDLADEVVILNVRHGEYYGLNAVGARIWALIQQPSTVQAVRDALLEEYPDAGEERCTRDMLALLDQLAEADLISILPPAKG
jgi:hypothetical protein